MRKKDFRAELLRTGMGCFLFAAAVSAVNVLILPYARTLYGCDMLPVILVCALAVAAFMLLGRMLRRQDEQKLERIARAARPAFILLLFALQLLLGHLMEYTPSGDNAKLYNGAQLLAQRGSFIGIEDYELYMAWFSNQWGSLLLLTGFFKLLGLAGISARFFPLVILQAILYAFAVRSALRLARRLRGVRGELMMIAMLACCLPLYLSAAVLYTDTFSLPFIVLAIEKAHDVLEREGKAQLKAALCCGLYVLIGGQIKMTVFIVLIAAVIVWCLRLRLVRALLYGGLCLAMLAAGTMGVRSVMLGRVINPALYEQYNTPPIHWVMMSIPTSDNPYGGLSSDYAVTWGLMDDQPREVVMDSIYTRIKDRVYTLRYPNRLITAALRKNSAFMGDGTFGMTEMLDDKPLRMNAVSSVVLEGQPHYTLYMALCTGISMAHLLMAAAGCLRDIKKHDLRAAMLYIAMFGAMLFMMFWEARSRYIWGFVPVWLLLSCAFAAREEGRLA